MRLRRKVALLALLSMWLALPLGAAQTEFIKNAKVENLAIGQVKVDADGDGVDDINPTISFPALAGTQTFRWSNTNSRFEASGELFATSGMSMQAARSIQWGALTNPFTAAGNTYMRLLHTQNPFADADSDSTSDLDQEIRLCYNCAEGGVTPGLPENTSAYSVMWRHRTTFASAGTFDSDGDGTFDTAGARRAVWAWEFYRAGQTSPTLIPFQAALDVDRAGAGVTPTATFLWRTGNGASDMSMSLLTSGLQIGGPGVDGALRLYNEAGATDYRTSLVTAATSNYTYTFPTALPGGTSYLTVDTSGNLAYSAGTGAVAFNTITGGTNAGETLVVGNGSTLSATGTGVITATQVAGSGSTTGAVDLATAEVAGVLPVANGGTNASSITSTGMCYAASGTAIACGSKATWDNTNMVLTLGDATTGGVIDLFEDASDPACAAGSFKIWADSGSNTIQKCQNGVVTDIDTTGGAPGFDTITGATNTSAAMVVGAGAILRPNGATTASGQVIANYVRDGGATVPLACGASSEGNIQVGDAEPLSYCDSAGTPVIKYAAYGNTSGESSAAANDSVALTTDTTGNYVTSISVSSPVACTGCTAAEGGTPALSIAADSITGTQIDETANYTWTGVHSLAGATLAGASPIVFEGTTADASEATLAVTDPVADTTITLPTQASGFLPITLFTNTANASIDLVNGTSETSIMPASGVGSTTIPANFFVAGRTVNVRLRGYFNAVGSSHTLTLKFKVGGTAINTPTAVTFSAGTSSYNGEIDIDVDIVCLTSGAGGTMNVVGHAIMQRSGSATTYFNWTNTGAATALDTTASKAIDVSAQWSTADAANEIYIHSAKIVAYN